MVVNNQNSNNVHNIMHDIINPIFAVDFFFIFTLFYLKICVFSLIRLKFKQILFHT